MARRNGRFLVKRGIDCYTQMEYETCGKPMNRIKLSPLSLRGAGIFFLVIALSLHACGRGGGRHRGGRPPAAPTGVAVTAFSGAVVIGWDPVDGATSYNVYVAAGPGVTKTNYETLPFGKRNPAAAGPFTQSDLLDGTPYYFVVTAVNEAGESAESAEVSATPTSTALPLPPTGLRAIAADGQVTLEWNSVTGASSYFLYRATVSGINRDNWNTIVGGNRTQVPGGATVYIEDDLTNGTTYFFVVTAQNNLGQGAESAEVSATPFAAETVPVQPTNLTASAADSEVILNWNAAAGAQFYNVYWSTTAEVTPDNGTKIPNLSGTSYTHTALTNNTLYYYILTAENAHGESLPSEEASATPIPIPPPAVVTLPPSEVLKTGSAILHGEVNPLGFSGETTVYFEWGVTTAYGSSTALQTTPGGNTFVPIADGLEALEPNRPYHYRIVATNSRGTNYGADQSFILPFLGEPNEFSVEPEESPSDVAIADFDGDSISDLATTNFGTHKVSILFGIGNWADPEDEDNFGFDTVSIPVYDVGNNPEHLAAGKFHGNLNPADLVVSNGTSGTMTLLSNNGNGIFTPASIDLWTNPADSGKTFPSDLLVADFNEDGNPDVAVSSVMSGVGNVVILIGDGVGGFASKTLFAAGVSPSGIASGDFNGDTHLDLVVTNELINTISLLLGDGAGSFEAPTSFSVGSDAFHRPVALASEDFNEDGILDLAVVNRESGTVSIFLNDGAGGFAAPTRFPVGLEPQGIAVGDFNRDRKPDLIIPNFHPTGNTQDNTESVTIYLGVGDGTFGPSREEILGEGKNPVAAATGYFDDDPPNDPYDPDDPNANSKLDLVVVNRSGNSVSVLLGQ
ncbi:hypothetical protein MNODULE_12655 [Nitrospiraceae bacterium HYJII51-Mn-bac16s-1-B09]|uniref:Fibronectin type-III domain-containing protein n=2 Tax=Candidatus Manganitrophus noduliformans TaxID=2606439 RepID=A0A7X6IBA9_9BACT|nr:hypothetical protein [Candidatus Manganitrophus noduliformans]